MPYTLHYHPVVPKEDLPRINQKIRVRIQRAIEERLLTEPIRYGAPLRRSLHGFRKLRVGDYRVIYEIVKSDIRIYAIRHRKDVYGVAPKRL